MNNHCIFCQIANGSSPCHKFWEDDKHLAFLSIFPNTPGFSVVITKEHYSSYVFDLDNEIFLGLITAAKKAAKALDLSLNNVSRTGMIAEGYGVDHAHIKLFPMHQTPEIWQPIKSNTKKFFHQYEGYLSSHDSYRANDEDLAELASHIRKSLKQQ